MEGLERGLRRERDNLNIDMINGGKRAQTLIASSVVLVTLKSLCNKDGFPPSSLEEVDFLRKETARCGTVQKGEYENTSNKRCE